MKKNRNSIPDIKDKHSLLYEWLKSTIVMHRGHHTAASYFQRIHRVLGITSTVFNVVVASSLFFALTSTNESEATLENRTALILGGIFSVLAAILTGVFSFVKYDEIAIKHLQSATKFQAVRRLIEQNISQLSEGALLVDSLEIIRLKWTAALENSIPLGQRFYNRISNKIGDN